MPRAGTGLGGSLGPVRGGRGRVGQKGVQGDGASASLARQSVAMQQAPTALQTAHPAHLATPAQPIASPVPSTELPADALNLIWLDCEMSGLDPERERLLEVAVVATDPHLRVRVDGPVLVLRQSDALLEGMDKWNKSTHGKSGLIDKVRASTLDEAQAQAQLLAFVQRYVPRGQSPMCGNSIGQDRRFLARYMPELAAYFHYRNIDVSTLKELSRRWAPQVLASFKKQQQHTALADVHESIDELLHYRAQFLRLPGS